MSPPVAKALGSGRRPLGGTFLRRPFLHAFSPLAGRNRPFECPQLAPSEGARARRFRQQALEAAAEHFAHHGEVVAGGEIGRADVELAVLVLAEPVRPGDDHGADRVGALDVAVVIDLDPPRRLRQSEARRQRRQEPLLGGRLGELASQRLARIGERMLDQVALLAPLRHRDLDLVPALDRERFRQQLAVLGLVGHEDQPRARLIVVELREERAQHLLRRERAIGAGEIGAVAPVLSGAEEEHLDAIETAVPGGWRRRRPPRRRGG